MILNLLTLGRYFLSDRRLILPFLIILGGAPSVQATESCKSESRSIAFGKIKGKVEGYICRVGKDEDGILVHFYRIDEVIAGSLLMGTSMPVLAGIFDKMTLIETPASKWARDAFKNYGKKENYEESNSVRLSITATSRRADDWQSLDSNDMQGASKTPVAIWRLLDEISGGSDQLLLKKPGTRILNSNYWPDDFNMYYPINPDDKMWRKQIITNTVIWKYLKAEELNDLLPDVKSAVARVERAARLERDDDARETLKHQATAAAKGLGYIESIFMFVKSLSNTGPPNDFMNISTAASIASPCGGDNWSFTLTVPSLRFDLVTVENIGKHRLVVKDLIGTREDHSGFHSFEGDARQAAEKSPLALGPMNLEPGQKAGVMVRVLFVSRPENAEGDIMEDETGHEISETIEDERNRKASAIKASDTAYKFILSKKPNSILTQKIAGFTDGRQVRKLRESFKSPTFPDPHDYAYGPEISIVGLETGGDARELSGAGTTSFMFGDQPVGLDLDLHQIDLSREQGISCPRLYVWNGDLQDWVVHGKIIHSANGVSRKMTEHVSLKTVSTRFRIAEEELEAAYIDDLRLNLKLVDGRELLLAPRSVGATTLTMNTYKDIDFDFPEGVSAKDVAQSELIVTGYYRRYSDMLKELALGDAEKAHLRVNNVAR